MTGFSVFLVGGDEEMKRMVEAIARQDGYRVVRFVSAEEFLQCYDSAAHACLMTALHLPGLGGGELLRKLGPRQALLPAIVFAPQCGVPQAVAAVRHGAIDVIEQPFQASYFRRQMALARQQDEAARNRLAQRRQLLERVAALTDRERQVVDRVLAGAVNKQIALQLEVGVRTVELDRARAMQKLGAHSLADLARIIAQSASF